eukprot:symbB.v1.2.019152.t1/scaffold1555.1/size186957/6
MAARGLAVRWGLRLLHTTKARHALPAATAVAAGLACFSLSLPNQRRVTGMAVSQDELKKQVGYKAVDDYVKSGMVIGLGTGSTAYFAVERVGQKCGHSIG